MEDEVVEDNLGRKSLTPKPQHAGLDHGGGVIQKKVIEEGEDE